MNKRIQQSLVLTVALLPLFAQGGATFDFDDGTTQGWTLDQMYDTASQVKFTPLMGYTLGNSGSALTASASALLIGNANQNDIYLESPDLTADPAWQGVDGYSVDVTRNMYSPCWGDFPNLWYVQLQARVIDTADGNQEKLFAESNGGFVFHEILNYGQLYHLAWTGWPLNDTRYIIKNVRLRITGPGDVTSECWYRGNWTIDNVIASSTGGPVETLLSCSGTGGDGDFYDRGFYVPQYPGVSLNSAELKMSAATAGTYEMMLAVRSETYDGPILGVSSITVDLNGSTSENKPVSFEFPSSPIAKNSRVCFILSWISGPSTSVFYLVPTPSGCTEVVQTQGTTLPLDTFRRYGVDLTLKGSSNPQMLLSCSGTGGAGDLYDRGFYVPQFPGVSLNSAELKLSAAAAGTYDLLLTVRSNTYDGPILGSSGITVSLNGSTSENKPVSFDFPSIPIVKYSRVCFLLSLTSGPSTSVYYLVPTSGCSEVVQTQGTTPPLDTFRRYGVDLTLVGVNDPDSDLRLEIAEQPAGLYLYWNSIADRTYSLQTGTDFESFSNLQTGIPATPPKNSFGPIVVSPTGGSFYRVMLEPLPVP